MANLVWLLVAAISIAFGWLIWHNLRKLAERRRAEEARFARFMADSAGTAAPASPVASLSPAAAAAVAAEAPSPSPAPVPGAAAGDTLARQKLLFDAAHKAGEAGEPALAIQLYARLLSKYPQTGFAEPARTAVALQKKRLGKP